MARTPSAMVELGSKAPKFILPGIGNVRLGLPDEDQIATLVMFICNHCPFVVHVASELARLGRDYADKPIAIVAINSNDWVAYPDDSPERMAEFAAENGFGFPYLYDESQEVARAYGATCTPDFFLYDSEFSLAYRGQLDSSRPSNEIPCDGQDLRKAIDALLSKGEVSSAQLPSIGCNIKWRA